MHNMFRIAGLRLPHNPAYIIYLIFHGAAAPGFIQVGGSTAALTAPSFAV